METDVVAELLEIPLLSPLDETMEFSDILLSYIYAVVLRPLCWFGEGVLVLLFFLDEGSERVVVGCV